MRVHFYALPHAVALGGSWDSPIRRACYLKRNPRFIRVDIRISCETHLHVRENNFTARPARAVIALVIIAALLDLVSYSQKIRPCHRAGYAKIDIPYKKRLNEQEHAQERRTCRTHFSSHVETVSNFELCCGLHVFDM